MDPIHFNSLIPIPEDIFLNRITTGPKVSTCVCPACGKIVETTDHPYAYDPQENNVIYAGACPACGAAMYSHD